MSKNRKAGAGLAAARGSAYVVVHLDGRICLGPEGTPQLYFHSYRARQMAIALTKVVGKCVVAKVRYAIAPNS